MMISPLSRSHLRQAFFLCTLDGLLSVPLVFLAQPGNYLIATLLTKVFKFSENDYGLLVSLPFWCSFAQVFIVPMLTRRLVAKKVNLISGWLHLFAWLAFITLLPYFSTLQPKICALWFFLFFLLFSLLSALSTVGWNSWVQEWAWETLRGRYFGYRGKLVQLVTVLFLSAVGYLFSVLPTNVFTFQILVLFALVLRAGSLLAQSAMKVGHKEGGVRDDLPHLNQLKIIWEEPSFRLFMMFGVIWGFASNCFGPFYAVFMLNEIQVSPSEFTALVVVGSIALALSFPGWGLLLDRFGNKSVMVASIILQQTVSYGWCFITPQNRWMLYLIFIWVGYTNGGFLLGLFNLLLKLAPARAKTLAIGVNLAVTSLVMAVASIVGGHLLSLGHTMGFPALALYHAAFFFQPTLALLGCLVLVRIRETRASGIKPVIISLLSLSTLISLLGVTAFKKWIVRRPA